MSPKLRPDDIGWWWVGQTTKSNTVHWQCVEVVLRPWAPGLIDFENPILQIQAGCWIRADRVNMGSGIMDGSQWFPAALPSWPEGGAE
jgi:hypothetical protein